MTADYGAGGWPRIALCWQCGDIAVAEIPTGPPEHKWRSWCRVCLDAHVAGRKA